ncbi:MAG: hypothetical protein V1702_03530 [Candidatus Woesearchaeota archaeon]
MAFEMSLLEAIAKKDEGTLRKLVIPYDENAYAQPFELCETGTYTNFGPYLSVKDKIRTSTLKLGEIIFDEEGELYCHHLVDFPKKLQQSSGLVGLIIGSVPKESVRASMKGFPSQEKSSEIGLPKQFVYLFMDSPAAKFAVVSQMSGRMPVKADLPIMFYTKPLENDAAIGILVPREHVFEAPEKFRLCLS